MSLTVPQITSMVINGGPLDQHRVAINFLNGRELKATLGDTAIAAVVAALQAANRSTAIVYNSLDQEHFRRIIQRGSVATIPVDAILAAMRESSSSPPGPASPVFGLKASYTEVFKANSQQGLNQGERCTKKVIAIALLIIGIVAFLAGSILACLGIRFTLPPLAGIHVANGGLVGGGAASIALGIAGIVSGTVLLT